MRASRLHDLLGKYMKAEDPEEKSKFRAQLISAFWELGSRIAYRVGRELIMPKRLLLRFGILSPGFLSPELQDMVSRIIYENTTGEPVYYVDEWLERISKGLVRPSTTDEVKTKGKETGQKILDAVEKKRGQRDSELTILKAKISQMEEREAQLKGQVDLMTRHERNEDFGGLKASFNASQKAALLQTQELLRQLSLLDGQIASSYASVGAIDKELESLGRKSEGISADSVVDQKSLVGEWMSLRQMAKMCCGRQGNHFPIFLSQFVRPAIREVGTRENVIREMAQVEALDPGLFHRMYKTPDHPHRSERHSRGQLRGRGNLLGAVREVQPGDQPRPCRHPDVPEKPPGRRHHRHGRPAVAGCQGESPVLLDGRGDHREVLPVVHRAQAAR